MIRLETNKRYYLINLTKDLFDQWCIICSWGSKFSKIGNQQTHLVNDELSGQKLIEKIIKIRKNHGYEIIEE